MYQEPLDVVMSNPPANLCPHSRSHTPLHTHHPKNSSAATSQTSRVAAMFDKIQPLQFEWDEELGDGTEDDGSEPNAGWAEHHGWGPYDDDRPPVPICNLAHLGEAAANIPRQMHNGMCITAGVCTMTTTSLMWNGMSAMAGVHMAMTTAGM